MNDPVKLIDPGQPLNAAQTLQEEEPPKKPVINFRVSNDLMEVEMEFLPSGPRTLPPACEDVRAGLQELGVKFGIFEDALREICANPMFERGFLVARGRAPEVGADGYVKFLVETERTLRPKEQADGTMDYRDLGYTVNVHKGQPLCEIHHAQKGADGMDVYGQVLEGRWGKDPPSPLGKNTEMNEDNTLLLASCDGSVSVTRGIANVIDQLVINGNVDNSTGDINFPGNVVVKGDVVAGFRVTAAGNISVQGSVEGAQLEAKGDVAVAEGVNGMERGSISAGGSVRSKYIQSCFVNAQGDVYADSIMYCNIECAGNLELSGKRGRLIGGRAVVVGFIRANTIGTDSHVPTVLSLGQAGGLEKEIGAFNRELAGYVKEEGRLTQLMERLEALRQQNRLTPDLQSTQEAAGNSLRLTQANRTKTQLKLASVKAEQIRRQALASQSYVSCRGRIHTGVTIQFGTLSMTVNQSVANSRVMLVDGEIRFMNN